MSRIFVIPASNGDSIHSTSQIRLLSPLNYLGYPYQIFKLSDIPTLKSDDMVLIDRYGDLELDEIATYKIIEGLKVSKAKIIYFIDDDLFVESDRISQKIVSRVSGFFSISQRVVTTTSALQKKILSFGKSVTQIPIHVDYPKRDSLKRPEVPKKEISIGYMGTFTHIDDLYSWTSQILELRRSSPWKIHLEIVGGGGSDDLRQFSKITGAKLIHPPALSHDDFKMWMLKNCNWDFGLAPLRHKEFNLYKSDIKILDYAGIGAIPVVEDYEPYSRFLSLNVGVLTFEDLKSSVSSLNFLSVLEAKKEKMALDIANYRTFENQKHLWNLLLDVQ